MLRVAEREEPRPGGELYVYLGAAAGVGKTYAMLEEGRRLKEAGLDVVVGYVETHGRKETAARIGDLDVLPRKRIPYRGITLEELDVEAVLNRQPAIVLIDELAHSNAPGSANSKRYQDIQEILNAGITVITTMNIQHLEGINDVIESVTGVKVRETVPDHMLDEANVELIDLPPARLRERMMAGKIYPPEQARIALERFFRETNLTALRELALRRTAEGVEATLERYMLGEDVAGPWTAIEEVVVFLGESPRAERLIRHAWRLARGLRADFTAVSIIPCPIDELPEQERATLLERLQLAEDLGAETMTVVESSVADGIIRAARMRHATDIVIGPPERDRLARLRGSLLLDTLLGALEGVDIHIVNQPVDSRTEGRPGEHQP
jgi:two-component system sensor histidine kinase KdpD